MDIDSSNVDDEVYDDENLNSDSGTGDDACSIILI